MKVLALILLLTDGLCGQWMTGFYSAQNGVMPVSSIPWNKYTHIVHFAASTDGSGNVVPYYLSQAEITELIASRPPGKKVLVCIKDNDSNSAFFFKSTSPETIGAFVDNIASFVAANGYDGVDLDWEQNINIAQYENLLVRLRIAIPAKIITVDVGNWGGLDTVTAATYSALDQINVMCYDMDDGQNCNGHPCTAWYNSALFQNGQSDKRTCDWRVRAFTSRGVPNNKIGIGLPFFGRRWVGMTVVQASGIFLTYTITYRDLVTDRARWQPQYQFYDGAFKASYLSIPPLNEFVSYTGTQSIRDAAGWQKAQGFGGFMTYTLEYEYLPAATGDASHPLSTALYKEVFAGATQAANPQLAIPSDSPPRAR
ncbi:MAG TPA: glycoside hydrolase family 18 protein [Terriglobales bacterium]|nr:glycoside hydrolase family 18 protein [Terriglobales bacterium]